MYSAYMAMVAINAYVRLNWCTAEFNGINSGTARQPHGLLFSHRHLYLCQTANTVGWRSTNWSAQHGIRAEEMAAVRNHMSVWLAGMSLKIITNKAQCEELAGIIVIKLSACYHLTHKKLHADHIVHGWRPSPCQISTLHLCSSRLLLLVVSSKHKPVSRVISADRSVYTLLFYNILLQSLRFAYRILQKREFHSANIC